MKFQLPLSWIMTTLTVMTLAVVNPAFAQSKKSTDNPNTNPPNPSSTQPTQQEPADDGMTDLEITCKVVNIGVKTIVVCEKVKDLWHDVEDFWRKFWNRGNSEDSTVENLVAKECGATSLLSFQTDKSAIIYRQYKSGNLEAKGLVLTRVEFEMSSSEEAETLANVFSTYINQITEDVQSHGAACFAAH